MLATAQLRGNSIDIWYPPSDTHVKVVMEPASCIYVAGEILRYIILVLVRDLYMNIISLDDIHYCKMQFICIQVRESIGFCTSGNRREQEKALLVQLGEP